MNGNSCEINAKDIKQLEVRVAKLEEYRERDKSQVHELDTSLKVFITEMKSISNELQTVVSNFKEAIMRSNASQEKELGHLKEQVVEQGEKIKELDTKLEKETVEADAKKWQNIVTYVLTTIIGIIVGYIAMSIGLK